MARRWRWFVVAASVLALVGLPAVVDAWPVSAPRIAPEVLAARISASAAAPFSGTVATRGGLAVPDVPGLGDQADLLGSSSRLRVWYVGPSAWRVDVVSPVGEIDTYAIRQGIAIWDSGRDLVRVIDDEPALRLPRAADLVPPELARRLLAGAGPEELQPLAPARIAGRSAAGVRIVPADPTTTVARVDIWADATTGVALRVAVVPRGTERPIVEATFLEVDLRRPADDVVSLDPPAGARLQREGAADPIAEIGRRSSIPLPPIIGGLARTSDQAVGVASYGVGFGQVLVVAVPEAVGARLLLGSLPVTTRPWGGEARLVETPLVNAMGVTARGTAYLVAGSVTVAELDRIVAALVAA